MRHFPGVVPAIVDTMASQPALFTKKK